MRVKFAFEGAYLTRIAVANKIIQIHARCEDVDLFIKRFEHDYKAFENVAQCVDIVLNL